ncbi:MAG TPA: 50S ribosomal protein L21 [Bacteroidota bacterium]|nr:50S ribosomal protein L21 [Bacteroidota bacterium]
MYAVVEIAGQQFKVVPDAKLYVPKLKAEVGAKVKFDKVLLVGTEKETTVGKPTVSGKYVEAKVLQHLKDEKVLVFRKKRRKGFKVRRGHRQQYTEIQITKVA